MIQIAKECETQSKDEKGGNCKQVPEVWARSTFCDIRKERGQDREYIRYVSQVSPIYIWGM